MDNEKIPPGPACPGKVKTRPTTTRLTLSSASNVLDVFRRLREDLSGSGDEVSEEAFLELLARYDIHVSELSSFVSTVEQLDSLFTAVTYNQAARCFWLDPSRGGEDMRFLEIYRSRIPSHIFKGIVDSWDMAITQYGPLQGHGEVARPRVITTLFEKMGAVFKSAVISKPGGLLNRSSIRPRFRKQYEILQELSNVVFLQVSRELASGSSALDVKAWLLAECSVTDYINDKNGHWAPVFAILCDGNNFEFFVVDSAAQIVHSSGWVRGIPMKNDDRERTLLSIKRITEILFDFFIMAFINGLRSIAHSSTRIPTEISTNALTTAEYAHYLLRKANAHTIDQQWKEAEDMASAGVERLNTSVRELSEYLPDPRGFLGL
ncbi:uncharacterized protein ACHE_30657A [Aspergillus chevalieri]|uniref:Uncharacterized protein n=1 Tax=Aspergillus chevalieri TaxID=182096 RepID=A0A7R7VL52_ASPCH|nr:uncharacterized protein ACHE_30657A [Aspergillus chevalieri]BCR86670.1 hypothetical protein ACHE_30657A [Aspergillus chevalieri]